MESSLDLGLVDSYLLFCQYREECNKNSVMDLAKCDWLYPTSLLPLIAFMKEKKDSITYNPPLLQEVNNYIKLIMGEIDPVYKLSSYLPIVSLPSSIQEQDNVLKKIYDCHNNGKYFGGENAFKYMIGELVGNIYEHSKFNNAFVMAQHYGKRSENPFAEISFFDDGITIPGSYAKVGMVFEDDEALIRAINGLSTRGKERGFGLGTNVRLVTEGFKGQILVVSRNAAILIGKGVQNLYKLSEPHILQGTLISVRIPISEKEVQLYDYIN